MRNVSSANCWQLVRAESAVFQSVSWVLERNTSTTSWLRRKGLELNPCFKEAVWLYSGLELSLLRTTTLTVEEHQMLSS